MTSSVSAAIAWPLIGALVCVVAARWRWFNGSAAEQYLNTTLTVIAATQLLREDVVQKAVAAWLPVTVTAVQQLSLCAIVGSIGPFLCVIDLLSGKNPVIVRRRQFGYYAMAGLLSAAMLVAGSRARREGLPVEVSGGLAEVLVWVAFAVLPLYLAVRMIRRCWAEFRQPGSTAGERAVLTGIAVAGAAIGVTTAVALILAVLQELGIADSVEYRLQTNSRNFFWIATIIGIVAAAPLIKSLGEVLGVDATSRRWRRLQPLWRSMTALFPDSRLPLDDGAPTRRVTVLQLHRTTVEIRDAMLELRPYLRETDPSALARFVAVERVPRTATDSAGHALQLAYAARLRAGRAESPGDVTEMPLSSAPATLGEEVAELVRLAAWWPAACRFVANHPPDTAIDTTPEPAR
ncbi:MAB_1171c family putative transporter [Nocardia wallacei]|uniref:MAB_1171c family putative transporter n=1 Tax=Nocardia wallacei TaxID=480035 RepID=UPI002455C900|nr:MAB_1171c family putative transporter [Nocardia wallacei]